MAREASNICQRMHINAEVVIDPMTYLVVLLHGGDEDDGVDAFEAVKPLLALGPLATDVDQVHPDPVDVETCFCDAWKFLVRLSRIAVFKRDEHSKSGQEEPFLPRLCLSKSVFATGNANFFLSKRAVTEHFWCFQVK